jgi:hypothetical protein
MQRDGMETTVDNDFAGLDRPRSFGQWSLETKANVAAGFWTAVAHELGYAITRDLGSARSAEFTEQLFRVHQREFFVAGLKALGLADVTPDTTKCVLYHCMSNSLGGIRARYAVESPSKAWVLYLPSTLSSGWASYTNEASLAAFKGWYANNGPALGNDRLAFVVTHLISQGDPFDAGYFVEAHYAVEPEDRCRFEPGTTPPPASQRRFAAFDDELWPEARRLKARRNFAVDWAWNHVGGAGALLGESGIAAVRHAFGIVVNVYLPYFRAAVGGGGASMIGRYFQAVHEIAGFPVSTSESDAGFRVNIGHDPLERSSFKLSKSTADALHQSILDAWTTMTTDYGVAIRSASPSELFFADV